MIEFAGSFEARPGITHVLFDFDGKLLELLAKSPLPQYDRRRVSFAFEIDDIRSARAELINPVGPRLKKPAVGAVAL